MNGYSTLLEKALSSFAWGNNGHRLEHNGMFMILRDEDERLLKQVANKAAGEKTPEAYPLGYVEDFSRRERRWALVSATA